MSAVCHYSDREIALSFANLLALEWVIVEHCWEYGEEMAGVGPRRVCLAYVVWAVWGPGREFWLLHDFDMLKLFLW